MKLYDKNGFDTNGIHKETASKYDLEGFDKDGYNELGYDRQGYNRNGYTKDEVSEMEKNGIYQDSISIDKKIYLPMIIVSFILVFVITNFLVQYVNDFKPSDRKIIRFLKSIYPDTEFSIKFEHSNKFKEMGSCDGSPIDSTSYYHRFTSLYEVTNLNTQESFNLRYEKEIPHRKECCSGFEIGYESFWIGDKEYSTSLSRSEAYSQFWEIVHIVLKKYSQFLDNFKIYL